MRLAFFSPLPPARSGIADYSEALLGTLSRLVSVEVFSSAAAAFDPAQFDTALFHIGNNGHHDFVYEAALQYPGVVVMHESNLHHLIADLTIKRGDWEGYLTECEYNGGPGARAFAERVRRLEIGPDYEGVAMTRRVLESARGLVVHSRFVEQEMRGAGYSGPIAVIPHGAWVPEGDRNGYRERLGLDARVPLIGIFGFLKPYKRITESLRAFRRLIRVHPDARLILVGESHPEFQIAPMLRSMGLSAYARLLEFQPIEDFVGYLSACDIVLNLRYPTVGESSGTLLRSLGLGKAVLVSDLGSFREFPDDVCLKVPVGAGEEDLIFEYLNLLVSRPEVAAELGAHARAYVARECSWDVVARRYAQFLECVAEGREYCQDAAASPLEPALEPPNEPAPREKLEGLTEYLRGWAADDQSRGYVETHRSRLERTLEITPPGGPGDRILEMGAYMQITPALKSKLGYGEVRGCYYGPAGRVDHRTVTSAEGEPFECAIDHFDAEKDCFPYPDNHYATVLCCELLEHLTHDPMHMMAEIHRILKPGGHLVLTTPNAASLRAINAILEGYHPGFFSAYIRPSAAGEVEARHSREYAPREIRDLLVNSGFEVLRLETGEFREEPHPEFGWVLHLLQQYRLSTDLRGDGIYTVGRKIGPIRERYPSWLYA
ncbi:MAG: methyltransferase domain-containing protein [Acidobacteriia bacterium]|nr:methyltransferase domain-containing protein [Terriglobia bacterium]